MLFELWLIAIVRCRYWIECCSGKMALMKTLWKRNFTNAMWFIAKDFFNLDPFLCKSRQINILKIIDMLIMRKVWIGKCMYAIFFLDQHCWFNSQWAKNSLSSTFMYIWWYFFEKNSKISSNYISKWLNLLDKCHLVSAFVCYFFVHSVKWKYMIGISLI